MRQYPFISLKTNRIMWTWVAIPPAVVLVIGSWRRGLAFWGIVLAASVLFGGATLGLIDSEERLAPRWMLRLPLFLVGPWVAASFLTRLRGSALAGAIACNVLLQVFPDVAAAEAGTAIVLVTTESLATWSVFAPALVICALLRYATCSYAFFYAAYVMYHVWIALCIYSPRIAPLADVDKER